MVVVEHELADYFDLAADVLPEEVVCPRRLTLGPIVWRDLDHDARLRQTLLLDVSGRVAVLETLGDGAVEADPDMEVRFICSRQPTVRALGSGLLNEVEIADQADDVALSDEEATQCATAPS